VRAEALTSKSSREKSLAAGEDAQGERAGGERINSRWAWSKFADRRSQWRPSKKAAAVLNADVPSLPVSPIRLPHEAPLGFNPWIQPLPSQPSFR